MAAVNVEVYVDRDCSICRRSKTLAAEVQAEFPDVRVELIDLSEPGGEHRHLVVAAPTFILNGSVFSLGNPARADLRRAVEQLRSEVSP